MTDATDDPARDELAPGTLLAGRYEVTRRLGEGGMGAVYAARHAGLDRPVAVKVLRAAFGGDRTAVERFRKEARVLATLRHRHVVEVLDFGDDAGRLYLVMELLDGESLQARLDRERTLRPADALAVIDPVLGALAWAHAAGVVHRDVKPDNVFLARMPGEEGFTVKLLDFGIAYALAGGQKLTQTGVMVGTPAYMAPEQAWGAGPVTPAADQWSAAAMLYEMLSGHLPNESSSLPELVARRVAQDAADLATLRPGLPPALTAAVMRALARDPAARFASAEAFREALRASLAESPTATPTAVVAVTEHAPPEAHAKDAATTDTVPEAPAVAATTPAPSVPAPSPTAPTRLPSLALAAAAVTAAALVFVALRPSRTSPAPRTQPAPPPAPAVAEAVFVVRASPSSARVFIDGAYVGRGGAAVRRARDGRPHELRVEAPGYAPHTEVLRADGDVSVTAQLTPEDAAAPPPPAIAPTTRPASPHGARTPRARIDTTLPP
ncbi:MAG: serine/threonine-protein kinase [Polyangiales bacterium]